MSSPDERSARVNIGAAQVVLDAVPFHARVLHPRVVAADTARGQLDIALDGNPDFCRSTESDALHGGVVASLIDLAAYNAAALHKGLATPTLDLRIDYLRPAVAPLLARARVMRAGRSVLTVDVTVEDSTGRLVALGRGSFAVAGG